MRLAAAFSGAWLNLHLGEQFAGSALDCGTQSPDLATMPAYSATSACRMSYIKPPPLGARLDLTRTRRHDAPSLVGLAVPKTTRASAAKANDPVTRSNGSLPVVFFVSWVMPSKAQFVPTTKLRAAAMLA